MFIKKSEFDFASFIKTLISTFMSDVPSDRGSEDIIAEHIEQTTDY